MRTDFFVDSHCHLENLEEIDLCLEEARKSNVKRFVTIGVHHDDLEKRLFLANHEDVYFTVGLHPCYIERCGLSIEAFKDHLRVETKKHKRIVGLGETGLDLQETSPDFQKQRDFFWAHMELSLELSLPLVIHTRNADAETMQIFQDFIKTYGRAPRFILHCFTGGQDLAKFAIHQEGYVSFSGILTFQKAKQLQEIAKILPLEHLLIETDCPWLAPVPFRGKPNQPAYVVYTAKHLADLKNLSLDEVRTHTTKNAFSIFSRMA